MCCTINKPEENCPLNQIFQLVASASTVELIQNWYIGKICNCNGNCSDTKNMINILNIIEKDFPNLTLITQILSKLIIGFQRFQENTSDASASAGTSASSDKGVAELDTQGAAKSKSIDIAVWDDELQDMLEAQTSSFLFGLKTNYINAISGETYESKAAKGIAVAVVPPGALIQSLEKIANPITLEYGQIHGTRKFLQSVSPQHCAVLSAPRPHEENDGKFAFQGIALVSDCIRRFPIIVFRRHMQWELHLPHQKDFDDLSSTNALISYQSGRLGMPKVSADKFITARLNENATSASDLQKFLLNLLENSQNSGFIVIVGKADAIKEEAIRLCKNKRGYLFEKEVPLNSNEKFFEHIAKVDGALLCSYDYCYGYGFILDGPSVEGRADRGARHNSTQSYAASFCQNYGSKCMAFVLSEDGMISIY